MYLGKKEVDQAKLELILLSDVFFFFVRSQSRSTAFLFAVVVFTTVVFIPGGFAIQPPYPDNQHVIEHTSVAVTCVAYDTDGVKKPERIDFVKRTDDPVTMLQTTIVLKDSGTIYFTNRTEGESCHVSNKASG